MLKFAFLGAWHSHAAMHVREAAARPGEVELVGMYDPDPAVIQQNQERWAEHGLDVPVFASIEDVLNLCGLNSPPLAAYPIPHERVYPQEP